MGCSISVGHTSRRRGRPRRRIALAVALIGLLAGHSHGAEKRPDGPFADQPAGSLIRRLQGDAGAARAAGRWVFGKAVTSPQKYRPLTYRNDTWYGSTYWGGPDWTRVGKDWHHPGINTPAVRCFRAPAAGRVAVTGRVYKADTNKGGGDGVRLSVRHNERTVWQAEINGNDGKGVEPKLTLDLARGDAVRFVVHKRGRIFCDTTRWDPIITYAGGKTYQASKGFTTGRQGVGPWSYEMEGGPRAKTGSPRVHAFDSDLAPVDRQLAPGAGVSLTAGRHMPAFVLADGHDASGVVFAVSPVSPWRFDVGLNAARQIEVTLRQTGDNLTGEPKVVIAPYTGTSLAGTRRLDRLLSGKSPGALGKAAAGKFTAAYRTVAAAPRADRPEIELLTMVQLDWRRRDGAGDRPGALAAAAKKHIARTRLLLADLRKGKPRGFLADEQRQLDALADQAGRPGDDDGRQGRLYRRVRWLKRRIALGNPLMDFGPMLFCKRVPTAYSHLVMQYFGWRARPGGGLFVLPRPGKSLAVRDILDGRLAGGSVLAPRLSYDARRVVFSFVSCNGKSPLGPAHDAEAGKKYYHLFEVDLDPSRAFAAGGSGLRRLTSGPFEDLMPTYLPDGGIAFSSTRRRGYARCFGGQFGTKWHVYTLHRIDSDGGNLRTLSYHDTNEWFPAVANDGRILYSRWDYIDRDAVTHQNLWSMRPDGTNPAAVWGNATPSPHCTFQIQPVPGSGQIAFTASAHHSITAGSIALVDPTRGRDGQQAITRITPEVVFPEAEGRNIREYYAAPWPLSEKYFLAAYSPVPLVWEPGANSPNALGLYLIDAFGNRELLYRDSLISSTSPCPLRPRRRPPVITGDLPPDAPPTGEIVMSDVYRGLGPIRRGTVKALRIIQIFPKTTNLADRPIVGAAREENARAILGTVPVEPDGSARFIVPARIPILFQALDADGLAVQTMRSITYLQPGERVSCVGCHEPVSSVPATLGRMRAMARPPAQIAPGTLGGRPFSFMAVVQPVLTKHCAECHTGAKPKKGIDLSPTPHNGFTKSYWSLCGDRNFWGRGTNPKNAAEALVPRFGARNVVQVTPPGGMYGSPGSRLMKMLRAGTMPPPPAGASGKARVRLSADDIRRIAAWIDCNAIFYGVYDPGAQARQFKGLPVPMPDIQ